MKANSRNVVGLLCAVLLVDLASNASAQPGPSVQQEAERAQQENADRWRRSRLVGAGDSLAIDLPGEGLISVAPSASCEPPRSRGGVIQVDCADVDDGVVYYFDEATRAMIEPCDAWLADPKRCPPPQWPIELPGCDGSVPKSITGVWRFYALPGADGFYSYPDGWTLTLDEDSIFFGLFRPRPQVERSYTAVARGDGRYTLEIKDPRSATTTIEVELAPCGMIVESAAMCDAFCENLAAENEPPTEAELRVAIAEVVGENVDEATMQRMLAGIAKVGMPQPRPPFQERVYFRAVTAGD